MTPLAAIIRRAATMKRPVQRGLSALLVITFAASAAHAANVGGPAPHASPAGVHAVAASAPSGPDAGTILDNLRHSLKVIATIDTDKMPIEVSAGLLKDMAARAADEANQLPGLPDDLADAFRIGETDGLKASFLEVQRVEGVHIANLIILHRPVEQLAPALHLRMVKDQQVLEARLLDARLVSFANNPTLTPTDIQNSARDLLGQEGVATNKAFDLTESMNSASAAKVEALNTLAQGLAKYQESSSPALAETVRRQALECAANAMADHLAAERVLVERLAREGGNSMHQIAEANHAASIADAALAKVAQILSRSAAPQSITAARDTALSGALAAKAAMPAPESHGILGAFWR